MRVQLLAYTPDPERLVASAAKLCYSAVGVEEISERMSDESKDRFIGFLSDIGHESPIEHISFTFAIEGISRTLTHQLVRHRLASYSQQSQRYVRLESFEYIVPPAVAANPEANALFLEIMKRDQEVYDRLAELLEADRYQGFLSQGRSEKDARKLAEKAAIEDARYVFPNACETKIVVTMNARSLMHFFRQRCCNRAQWEIHRMADQMLTEVRMVAPSLFKLAGPPCLGGPCPEKTMTCGLMREVVARYSQEKL